MTEVKRKITYRLYPNKAQLRLLEDARDLHCRTYNTLLEEKQRHYENELGSFGFSQMCKTLTTWRRDVDALRMLNAQSLQVTAKRLDNAFAAFFRRIKNGEEPGYPRFKKPRRFKGWGYKKHGDGWKVTLGEKNGTVYLMGIGTMKMRGKGRFSGEPKTAEVVSKNNKWYLSVTFSVDFEQVERKTEYKRQAGAFDWGLKTLLTIATEDGTETIDNPRWLKRRLAQLKQLQQAASAEQEKLNEAAGIPKPTPKGTVLPSSSKLKRIKRQVSSIHSKIARQRHDFYHKLSKQIVEQFDFLATEELDVESMVETPGPIPNEDGTFAPNGANQKAALNRSILDSAPGVLNSFIKTKAEEAGTLFLLANTKELKPTQRCHACGKASPKDLSERTHSCDCGASCDRDENAARTLLNWLIKEIRPGTGLPKQPKAA